MFGNNNMNQQPKNDAMSDIGFQQNTQEPTDSVSSIEWLPNQQQKIFAVGCWDGKLKVINVQQQGLMQQLEVGVQEPIMDIAWKGDGSFIFLAAGNCLKAVNVQSQQIVDIGQHQAGISQVFWSEPHQVVITTGFDNFVKIWMLNNQQPIAQHNIQRKVYCAAIRDDYIILGLQGEKLLIETITNLKNNQINLNTMFDSNNLGGGSQINSIALNHKDQKYVYAVASIDGRANLSFFRPNQQGNGWACDSIMTFKCHKEETQNKSQIMHPVNGIGFNCRNENFVYTAGSEGKMYFWDIQQKNKIKSFNFMQQPVTSAAVSPDGQCIAYALGYDWHAGYEKMAQYKQFKVAVHIIGDNEIRYQK